MNWRPIVSPFHSSVETYTKTWIVFITTQTNLEDEKKKVLKPAEWRPRFSERKDNKKTRKEYLQRTLTAHTVTTFDVRNDAAEEVAEDDELLADGTPFDVEEDEEDAAACEDIFFLPYLALHNLPLWVEESHSINCPLGRVFSFSFMALF